MIPRMPVLHKKHSFFLFGARGTGKSTMIEKRYLSSKTLWIDLLLHEEEQRFSHNPDELIFILEHKPYKRVVIDEVQKAPKLLDIIQKLMRTKPHIQFIMTGSSARKLRRGSGNLLAGRAFPYYLFPFSVFELDPKGFKASHQEAKNLKLKKSFHNILEFGSLPEVINKNTKQDKIAFLKSYTQTYLKEEILSEQIIRNLNPFRNFLQVAGQQNGQIVNYSRIAQDIKTDDKTVKNYFSILEDTLLGFLLPAYHKSFRKQQSQAPKFYFFDTGVRRALDKQIHVPLVEGTSYYGNVFEHRIILECFYLNEYLQKDFQFYHLRTKQGHEIDLVIKRPGKPDILLEIKSAKAVELRHIKTLDRFKKEWATPCLAQLWSQDKNNKKIQNVECLFWKTALKKLFS